MLKRILWLTMDLIIAALAVMAIWLIEYKTPKNGTQSEPFQKHWRWRKQKRNFNH